MPVQQVGMDTTPGILEDHGAGALGAHESARIWRHSALSGVELFQGSYRKHEFARHFHSVPAIGVVDRGSMRAYCRRDSHVIPAGTVLLLNPGEVHAPGPAGEDGWSFRVFFFEDVLFHTHSAEVSGGILRFSQPFVQDELLSRSLLRLHRKLEADATALETESALLVLFEQLAQKHASAPVRMGRAAVDKTIVNLAKDYIAAYYERNISLNDLSAAAHSSPYHLLRTFHKAVGLTPHAYLVQVRIEAAKRLLRMGKSISDVACSTGFTDQSHLTRHFKRITGVTPSRYRPHPV